MKKLFLTVASASLIWAVCYPLAACGPFFQPSYIKDKTAYYIVFDHGMALANMAESLSVFLNEKDIFPDGTSTKKAVIVDFNAALEKYAPHLDHAQKQKLLAEYIFSDGKYLTNLPEEMQEFILYRMGVDEMQDCGENMPASWQKLLSLPPEKRHYRTVWVHYMMGNILKGAACHKHYRNCRDAVRAGFADTPGLARASLANESRFGTDPVLTVHAALARQRHSTDQDFLYWNPHVYLPGGNPEPFFASESQHIDPALLKDRLYREWLAVTNCQAPEFLKAMEKYKFRNTDVMAYYAWVAGDWKKAHKYIAMLEKPTLLSLYIEAQLARMAGNSDLTLKKLHAWLKMVKEIKPEKYRDLLRRREPGWGSEDSFEYEVYGMMGNTLVMRKDFIQAAEFFCRSGQMETDFAIVAEEYMSLEELIKFADLRIKEFNSRKDQSKDAAKTLQCITHLLARRAFRENRMDIAQKYMPREHKQLLSDYLNFIAQGQNKKLALDMRALAFYNAFKIMRLRGMMLCGTEIAPDNFRYDGNYGAGNKFMVCKKCSYKYKSGKWYLCSKHAKEAARRELPGLGASMNGKKIPDHWRYHYRYRAADIALQAGDLAQNSDLKALLNYSAGTMLANRSPQEADVFYKRLVRQCQGSILAEAADQARWFPQNEVLAKEQKDLKYLNTLQEVRQLIQALP